MKIMKNVLLGATAISTLLCANPSWAAGEVIGINSAVKGDVSVLTEGQLAAAEAVVQDPIHIGDEINSKHLSSLQVLLKDQTVFTVGPDCLLTIDKYVYDPSTKKNKMAASVAKGMFRFMSGNISKSGAGAVSIDTPVASMGVRGTMVEGIVGEEAIQYALEAGLIDENDIVDRQGATLFFLRGPGRRNSGVNKRGEISVTSGGETVNVRKSGSIVFVANKDASPIEQGFVPDALIEVFMNRLSTKPVGRNSFKPFKLDKFMKKHKEADEFEAPEFYDPRFDMDWPEDEFQEPFFPEDGPFEPFGPDTPG